MSKLSELTSICESLGFGGESQNLNYKSTIGNVLVKDLGFDKSRLREVTDYNLFYHYPANYSISRKDALEILNKLNANYVKLVNTKTSTGRNNLVSLTLVQGEGSTSKLVYKLNINTITGITNLTML
jgi:hypothetical protein